MTKNQEEYWFWKKRKRCVLCHQKDAFTMNGRTYCAECTDRLAKYRRKAYEKGGAAINAARKEERARRRENGLCSGCGKPLETGSQYTLCGKCRAYCRQLKNKQRERQGEKQTLRRVDRADLGLCYGCGAPVKEGVKTDGTPYRLCDRCYQNAVKGFALARQALKTAKERRTV